MFVHVLKPVSSFIAKILCSRFAFFLGGVRFVPRGLSSVSSTNTNMEIACTIYIRI